MKKQRRFVRMFKPRFAPLVESGSKRQTVRPRPVRMPEPGDLVSLREWTGNPYRSKQRILKEASITQVDRMELTWFSMTLNGYAEAGNKFAQADGFKDFKEMAEWFKKEHGIPFEGIVIYW